MRKLVLVPLLALAVPGTALAAPPPNDNRADAAAIPAFPHTLTATTAEATVKRLDPQVSRCGRVEATVWYRVDTAPDGLIGITRHGRRRHRAHAAHLPARRVGDRGARLRRRQARRHGLGLARGGPRLQLSRPRRPPARKRRRLLRAAGGALPAPAQRRPRGCPAGQAARLDQGTTLGATGGEADPARCGLTGGTVWYRLASRRDGRVLLRLAAAGQLDAGVVVLEPVRSRTQALGCGVTDAAAGRPSVSPHAAAPRT